MSQQSLKAWTRPHDWAEVVLGILLALSPLVVDTSNAALWTMVILGALIALDGLASLAMPGMVYGEWVQIGLGVLTFIAPWVMSYTDLDGAAWTSWVAGVLAIAIGLAALPVATSAHRIAGQH